MEEKILIKSVPDKRWKTVLLITVGGLVLLALLCVGIAFLMAHNDYTNSINKIKENCFNGVSYTYTYAKKYYLNGSFYYSPVIIDETDFDVFLVKMYETTDLPSYWECLSFKNYVAANDFESAMMLVPFIINWTLIFISVMVLIFFFGVMKSNLLITEKEVKGKGLFGQTIVLPLYKISGYYANKVFSSVDISTDSKKVKFYCIKNHKEIGEVLSKIINKRQENTQISPKAVEEHQKENNLDELKKLKELLDSGVITQEEFEIKKKQILGL